MRSYLEPCKPFVLAPTRQPCDSFLPSSTTTGLMHLLTSRLTHSLFFFISGRGCRGVLVLCLTIFVWELDPELHHHHHHHSSPTWEFHRSGVMSGEAPPRQTDQECTNWEGKKEEAEVGSSQENTALHCSPTFAFHSSPLCFKITPFH